MGYHDCHTPAVILRNVLENPGWYTQYTPYQAEIAQGRLEALINFQTMVADLTGLPLANASLLDEATAAAEAMTLCRALAKPGRDGFFVAEDCHPQTIAVVKTRAEPLGIRVAGRARPTRSTSPAQRLFGVLVQYPATDGVVRDLAAARRARPRRGGARRRGHRPAGADAAGAAGRDGRRHRTRLGAALRRAAGLRRAARGLLRGEGRAQAPPARPPRRRVEGRRGPRGLPAVAADPRAAHPPRQGHEQHLHRAGAARGHGLDVRRLPRPAGPRADRAARPRARARAPARAAAARLRRGTAGRSSTRCACAPRPRPAARSSRARGSKGINLRAYADGSLGVALDETTLPGEVAGALRGLRGRSRAVHASSSWRTAPTLAVPAPHARTSAFLDAPGLRPPPRRARDAPLHAAGCRRATSRSRTR